MHSWQSTLKATATCRVLCAASHSQKEEAKHQCHQKRGLSGLGQHRDSAKAHSATATMDVLEISGAGSPSSTLVSSPVSLPLVLIPTQQKNGCKEPDLRVQNLPSKNSQGPSAPLTKPHGLQFGASDLRGKQSVDGWNDWVVCNRVQSLHLRMNTIHMMQFASDLEHVSLTLSVAPAGYKYNHTKLCLDWTLKAYNTRCNYTLQHN